MGATNFYNVATGKKALDAFLFAIRETEKQIEMENDCDCGNWNCDCDEYESEGYSGTIVEKSSFIEVSTPDGLSGKKAIIYIEKISFDEKSVPKKWREFARQWSKIYNDKWGSALAIKIKKNTYCFIGCASC